MKDKTVVTVKRIVQETADSVTIHFVQPPEKLNYLAGQFLTLIAAIGTKEERRAYSLSSAPAVDEALSVTVKRVKGGKMSNYLCDHIKVGDELTVLPPTGNHSIRYCLCDLGWARNCIDGYYFSDYLQTIIGHTGNYWNYLDCSRSSNNELLLKNADKLNIRLIKFLCELRNPQKKSGKHLV